MLIAVANVKGGQGKSTIAAALMGVIPHSTLLDLDHRQGDSVAWAKAAGRIGRVVREEEAASVLQAASHEPGWVVADCPPAESLAHRAALAAADVVVVPVTPTGGQDARAWGRMRELLAEAADFRAKHGLAQVQCVMLNAVRPRVTISDDFRDLLKSWHAPAQDRHYVGAVGQRIAYADAFALGDPIHAAHEEMATVLARITHFIVPVQTVRTGKSVKGVK